MSLVSVGVAVVVAIGVVVFALLKRPSSDLGAVSTSWIAQHRDS